MRSSMTLSSATSLPVPVGYSMVASAPRKRAYRSKTLTSG